MSQETSALSGQMQSDAAPLQNLDTSKSIGTAVTCNGRDGDVHIDSSGNIHFSDKRSPGLLDCFPGSGAPSQIDRNQIVGATLESATKFKVWYCQSNGSTTGNPGLKLCTSAFECNSGEEAEQMVQQIRQTSCWWGRTTPPKGVLILNPRSGNFKAAKIWKEVVQPILVGAAGWDVKAIETQHREHATEIVKELDLKQVDLVFFLGGDGTVYEGLQGLMQRSDWREAVNTPLCHIPGGTGNGVATSCGFWNALGAVRAACKGTHRGLDVASVIQPPNSRAYMVLSFVYGIVSNLEEGTEHLRWMGDGRFTYGAIREVMQRNLHKVKATWLPAGEHYQPPAGTPKSIAPSSRFHVGRFTDGPDLTALWGAEEFFGGCIPEQVPEDASQLPAGWKLLGPDGSQGLEMFTLANVPYLAASYHCNPKGALDSGHLDLCWGTGTSRIQSLQTLMAAESGEHLQQPWINSDTVRAMILEPVGSSSFFRADGEIISSTTVYLEVHPSLCRALVAPEMAR